MEIRNKFSFVVFGLFSFYNVLVFAQWDTEMDEDSCTTPNGLKGTCISIRQCKYILDIFATSPKPLPQSTIVLIQQHQCGFEGSSPKVCCPSDVPTTTTASTIGAEPPDVTNHPNIGLINARNCGPITIDKIYGGEKTAPFEYPWMALLAYNTRSGLDFRCGGTLINSNTILTAAHCITGNPFPLVGVRLGEHDINKSPDCDPQAEEDACAPPVQDFTIAQVIPHPQYDPNLLINDIGLVRIKGNANMESEAVRPICLPTGSLRLETLVGKNAIITGWGATETGYSSSDLLKIDLPIIATEECQQRYSRTQIKISNRQICAGGVRGKDSCSGDSGGPLKFPSPVTSTDSKYVQYGIVSFGPKFCGATAQPGVYTRVAFYMDWILNNLGP